MATSKKPAATEGAVSLAICSSLVSFLILLLVISYVSAVEICPPDKIPTQISISHSRHPANPIVGAYRNELEITTKLEWYNKETGERGPLPNRKVAFEISLFTNFSKEVCGGSEGCGIFEPRNNSEDAVFFRTTAADGTTHMIINLDSFFGQPVDPTKISYSITAIYSPNASVAADAPYFGSSDTESYTPSTLPPISIVACFPLLLVFGLLMAAMSVTGKNPFGYLDFSRVAFRLPRMQHKPTKGMTLATIKPASKAIGAGVDKTRKWSATKRAELAKAIKGTRAGAAVTTGAAYASRDMKAAGTAVGKFFGRVLTAVGIAGAAKWVGGAANKVAGRATKIAKGTSEFAKSATETKVGKAMWDGTKFVGKNMVWDTVRGENRRKINRVIFGAMFGMAINKQMAKSEKSFNEICDYVIKNGILKKDDVEIEKKKVNSAKENDAKTARMYDSVEKIKSEIKSGSNSLKAKATSLRRDAADMENKAKSLKKEGKAADAKAKESEARSKITEAKKLEKEAKTAEKEENKILSKMPGFKPFYTGELTIAARTGNILKLSSMRQDGFIRGRAWEGVMDIGGGARLWSISSQTMARTGVSLQDLPEFKSNSDSDMQKAYFEGKIGARSMQVVTHESNEDKKGNLKDTVKDFSKEVDKTLKFLLDKGVITNAASSQISDLLKGGKDAEAAVQKLLGQGLITKEAAPALRGLIEVGTESAKILVIQAVLRGFAGELQASGRYEDVDRLSKHLREMSEIGGVVSVTEMVLKRGQEMENNYRKIADYQEAKGKLDKMNERIDELEKERNNLTAAERVISPYVKEGKITDDMQKAAEELGLAGKGEKLTDGKIKDIATSAGFVAKTTTPTGEEIILERVLPSKEDLSAAVVQGRMKDLKSAQKLIDLRQEKEDWLAGVPEELSKMNRKIFQATGDLQRDEKNLALTERVVAPYVKNGKITEEMQGRAEALGVVAKGEKLTEDRIRGLTEELGIAPTTVVAGEIVSTGALPTGSDVNSFISDFKGKMDKDSKKIDELESDRKEWLKTAAPKDISNKERLQMLSNDSADAMVDLQKQYTSSAVEMISTYAGPAVSYERLKDSLNNLDKSVDSLNLAEIREIARDAKEEAMKYFKEGKPNKAEKDEINKIMVKASAKIGDIIFANAWPNADMNSDRALYDKNLAGSRLSPGSPDPEGGLASQILNEAFKMSPDIITKDSVRGMLQERFVSIDGTSASEGAVDANLRNLAYNTSSKDSKAIESAMGAEGFDEMIRKLKERTGYEIGLADAKGKFETEEFMVILTDLNAKLSTCNSDRKIELAGGAYLEAEKGKNAAVLKTIDSLISETKDPFLKESLQKKRDEVDRREKESVAMGVGAALVGSKDPNEKIINQNAYGTPVFEQMQSSDKIRMEREAESKKEAPKPLLYGDFNETTACLQTMMEGNKNYTEFTDKKNYVKETDNGYRITFKDSDDINARMRGVVAALDTVGIGNTDIKYDKNNEIESVSLPSYGIQVHRSGNKLFVEKTKMAGTASAATTGELIKGAEDVLSSTSKKYGEEKEKPT